jgi:hypothetical protein
MTLDKTTFRRNKLRRNDDRMTFSKMSHRRTMLSRNIVDPKRKTKDLNETLAPSLSGK